MSDLRVEILIVGGGVTGLWLLAELRARGRNALLVESAALGAGQTVASQGILHSGLKYSLQGLLTAAAREAREMPAHWRTCLNGTATPDLSGVEVRSQHFYLWGTDSTASKLGMLGARLGLQVTPQPVSPFECPPLLRGRGNVLRVEEQVVSPASLLAALAAPHADRILRVDADFTLGAATGLAARPVSASLSCGARKIRVTADCVVLAAGQANEGLRQRMGLRTGQMQRRPLHMVLVRGELPEFYGHCVDGAQTRVSITSGRDQSGRVVWQIGGQIAELGVALDESTLIDRAQAEVQAVLPSLDLRQTEWSTYRIDRAEGATRGGGRPDSYRLLREGNVLTCWPTKLVLVPQLVRAVLAELPAGTGATDDMGVFADWPTPDVAAPPWDRATRWTEYRQPRPVAA